MKKDEFILLNSVGCVINKDTEIVYIHMKDGSYECGNDDGTPILECVDDWWQSLSAMDVQILWYIIGDEVADHLEEIKARTPMVSIPLSLIENVMEELDQSAEFYEHHLGDDGIYRSLHNQLKVYL